MNSKEALDFLNHLISREKHIDSERNKKINECYNLIKKDLNQLEKHKLIEEELGCPLKIVFKALKQMFVFHKENVKTKIELLGIHIISEELYLYGFVEYTTQAVCLSLKDYGKTWTLT